MHWRQLVAPLGLLAAAGYWQEALWRELGAWPWLPYALAALAAALAAYYNRLHICVLALLLAGFYAVVDLTLQTRLSLPLPRAVLAVLGIAVPVSITLAACWPRAALRAPAAWPLWAYLAALAAAGAGWWWTGMPVPAALGALAAHPWWVVQPPERTLAPAALALFAAGGLLCVWRLIRGAPGAAAGLAALAATGWTLAELARPGQSLVMQSAAGLALLVALLQGARDLAYRDELTGLPARRALEDRLEQLGGRYWLAMLDVDHFKRVNDRYGHDIGDQVLRMVGAKLARLRGGQAYRYGGEEFCLVFGGRGAEWVAARLETLRAEIAAHRLVLRAPDRPRSAAEGRRRRGGRNGREALAVTVSIGLAAGRGRRPGPQAVLRAADRALYRAKADGRNRIVVAGDADA
ncbi:MAG: hypothetical protein KatS3mg121_1413 [Gammaproteobacteria bacterium]|nr:MAG: hypothetical protein KatS3mg121_1413 [Gammaproteobacteria bacterium]